MSELSASRTSYYFHGRHSFRLRTAPIFSQSVEHEVKKKERTKIGDEASGSKARKNEGLPA